jgi:hypothetical protein
MIGAAVAVNKVANGGLSALLTASSSLPSVVSAISSRRVVPPVEMMALIAFAGGASRSITLSVLFPSPA